MDANLLPEGLVLRPTRLLVRYLDLRARARCAAADGRRHPKARARAAALVENVGRFLHLIAGLQAKSSPRAHSAISGITAGSRSTFETFSPQGNA